MKKTYKQRGRKRNITLERIVRLEKKLKLYPSPEIELNNFNRNHELFLPYFLAFPDVDTLQHLVINSNIIETELKMKIVST